MRWNKQRNQGQRHSSCDPVTQVHHADRYTGIALCAPSRTLFLTTRRADTSKVWLISPNEYWRRSGGNFTSLPQHFRENGYLTLGTGKVQYLTLPESSAHPSRLHDA